MRITTKKKNSSALAACDIFPGVSKKPALGAAHQNRRLSGVDTSLSIRANAIGTIGNLYLF